jgi:hypothetical protein
MAKPGLSFGALEADLLIEAQPDEAGVVQGKAAGACVERFELHERDPYSMRPDGASYLALPVAQTLRSEHPRSSLRPRTIGGNLLA